MKCLVWRWMFAVAVVGLMAGVPSLAQKQTAEHNNPLDFLESAKTNLTGAAERVMSAGETLPPGVSKNEISDKLQAAAADVQATQNAWTKLYSKQHLIREKPSADDLLADQISTADGDLRDATDIIDRVEATDGSKDMFKKAKKALEDAKKQLTQVQTALQSAQPSQPLTPSLAVQPTSPVSVAATPQSSGQGARLYVVAGIAILLAVIAIVVVFLPWGPVEKLRSDKMVLQDQLKSLTSQHSKLRDDVQSLSKEKDELNKRIKKLTDAPKVTDQVPQEEWTTKERRTSERRKSSGIGSGSGAGAAAFVELTREGSLAAPKRANVDEVSEEDDMRAVPVKAVPKPRVPLADYNDARAKKPADRATEFSQQYAKQTAMTCSNPQVRNNGPFTDLRFREDQLGKFLAVEHGKELLLFPELNYDYSTGRKTLEGVFQYPEMESTAYRLTQAATVEKRGDEWALTRQGVFQNG